MVKSKEVKSKEVKSKEVKSKEVKSKEVKSKEVKSKEVKSKEVNSKDDMKGPIVELKGLADIAILPSPESLATHHRLWRDLPKSTWPRWRNHLQTYSLWAYATASRREDHTARTQSLVKLMMLPQVALVRARGGRKHRRTQRQLSNQLNAAPTFHKAAAIHQLPSPEVIDQESSRAQRAAILLLDGVQTRRDSYPGGPLSHRLTFEESTRLSSSSSSGPVPDLPDDLPAITVDTSDLSRMVRDRLSNGSAPGCSGWTGEVCPCLSG